MPKPYIKDFFEDGSVQTKPLKLFNLAGTIQRESVKKVLHMSVEFCSCGSIMVPVGKDVLRCRKCGHEVRKHIENKLQTAGKKEEVVVIENNAPDLPTTDKVCPKCRNDVAYYWLIQTRSIDEPPTQFFKCLKCKHVWREYK